MVEKGVSDVADKGKDITKKTLGRKLLKGEVGLLSIIDRGKGYNQENKEESC
jgi:hypothetical protein